MTVHGMHREARMEIHASPETVYDLVPDLPRMGEWSPENMGGEWQGGGSGKVAAPTALLPSAGATKPCPHAEQTCVAGVALAP